MAIMPPTIWEFLKYDTSISTLLLSFSGSDFFFFFLRNRRYIAFIDISSALSVVFHKLLFLL